MKMLDENASVLGEEEEVTQDFENASDPREESLIEEEEPSCFENASGLGEEGETSEEEEEAGPVMKGNSSNIEQRAGDESAHKEHMYDASVLGEEEVTLDFENASDPCENAHKENMYDATPVPEINQKRVI